MDNVIIENKVKRIWIFLCLSFFLQNQAVAQDAEPEFFDLANTMAANDTHIYYGTSVTSDAEDCRTVPESFVYGRIPLGGGQDDVEQLAIGCDAPQPNAMVADNQFTYVISQPLGTNTQALRIPVGSADAELISDASYTVIGHDTTDIYYFNEQSPYRVSKADITDQSSLNRHVRPLNWVTQEQIDDRSFWWSEGDGGENGAIRRLDKSGTGFVTVHEQGIDSVTGLIVTPDTLIWSETGGRIARSARDGAGESTLFQDADGPVDPVLTIHLSDDTLYFALGINASLWSMPVNGGMPTLIAIDLGTINKMLHRNGFIYYTNHNGGLYRVADHARALVPDYFAEGMEVTQGIQNGFNTVPMTKGHLTYVRVYPRENFGPSATKTTARLYGWDEFGQALPGSPIGPFNNDLDIPNDQVTRAQSDLSFNFVLPVDWLADRISLQAEVNPSDGDYPAYEIDYTNNRYPATPRNVEFLSGTGCMVAINVASKDILGNTLIYDTDSLDFALQLERFRSMFPGYFEVFRLPGILYKSLDPLEPWELDREPDRTELLNDTAALRGLASSRVQLPLLCQFQPVMTALAHNDTHSFNNGETGGRGNGALRANWTKMYNSTDHQAFNQPRGAGILAHEFGHAYGRLHVDCGLADDDENFDPDYPYPPCDLDFIDGEVAHWGYDGLTNTAIDPIVADFNLGAGDILSYRPHLWPSDYSWTNIMDQLNAFGVSLESNGSAALAPFNQTQVLYVNGRVDPTGQQGSLNVGYVFPAGRAPNQMRFFWPDHNPPGPDSEEYVIETVADDGTVLLQISTYVSEIQDGSGSDARYFISASPYDAATRQIRLRNPVTDEILDTLTVSPNRPQVTIDAAEYTRFPEPKLKLAWHGSDPDGPALRYSVVYSPNGGLDWIPLIFNTTATKAVIPAKHLTGSLNLDGDKPGSLIRIYASDGVNTAVDTSSGFIVDHLPPKEGAVFKHGDKVWLRAIAYDNEDGSLHRSKLNWHENGKFKPIGHGDWLVLEGLPPGEHTYWVTAKDNDNRLESASVTFTIERGKIRGQQ